jgi:hypothetical protein
MSSIQKNRVQNRSVVFQRSVEKETTVSENPFWTKSHLIALKELEESAVDGNSVFEVWSRLRLHKIHRTIPKRIGAINGNIA